MTSPGRFALLATTIAGLSSGTFAQEYLQVQVIEGSCDTLHATVSVFFPFGAGNACPPLTGFAVMPGDVTAFISLYYDISGPWPQLGCTTTETIAIPLPPGNPIVNLATFNIAEGDTSGMVADSVFNVCLTGIGDVPSNLPGFWVQDDQLRWSTPIGDAPVLIHILSSNGQVVRSQRTSAGRSWLGDLSPGIYSAWWPGTNGALFRFARQ